MRVLPVIDLKGKLVVRGIAGQRHSYQPIRSHIAADPSPATIARAFVQLGCTEVYVADLDAIGGGEPDWQSYEAIETAGLTLILDAGISNSERVRAVANFEQRTKCKIAAIAACESIVELQQLREFIAVQGTERAVFSLDLRDAQPIVACDQWRNANPFEIATQIVQLGFRRLIVLDLAAVGLNSGPMTADLCREFRSAFPELEIISGGGVRDERDVELLCKAGCDRVLVASALHDGRIRTVR